MSNLTTDISKLVRSDEAISAIDNGVWVGDFEGFPGLEFKVLGMTSEAAKKSMNEAKAEARLANSGEPLTEEQLSKVTTKVLASTVLKDWRGLSDGDEPVKFTRNLAQQWLTSRNGEQLALLVLRAAYQVDARAEDFVEKTAKN